MQETPGFAVVPGQVVFIVENEAPPFESTDMLQAVRDALLDQISKHNLTSVTFAQFVTVELKLVIFMPANWLFPLVVCDSL